MSEIVPCSYRDPILRAFVKLYHSLEQEGVWVPFVIAIIRPKIHRKARYWRLTELAHIFLGSEGVERNDILIAHFPPGIQVSIDTWFVQ